MEVPQDDRWSLADPQLALALLGTLRQERDVLIDDLTDERRCAAWLRDRLPRLESGPGARHLLTSMRRLLRELLTATVEGTAPSTGAVAELNELAARAAVTLAGQIHQGGTITLQRVSRGDPDTVLAAELARSALTLLAGPAREHLRLCRAPGCILFFLQHDRRQQWCSPNCGNRARVARHQARHHNS